MSNSLSDRQEREREEYNNRARESRITEIDFNHFDRPEFGPWNPYRRLYDFVLATAPPPGPRLLSYGCGTGRSALIYARAGYDVSGFDISEGLIDNARFLADKYELRDRARFSVQTAESLDYEDNTFDIVVGENILHHIDLPRAIPELCRVMKPGAAAVFKDSLVTPIRDRFRRNPPVTWILPLGVKNKVTGQRYRDTPDERPLTREDFALFRRHFDVVEEERYRVLALLASVFGRRGTFERYDRALFRLVPFLRRLGDNVVVIFRKGLHP
jgi:SAM-dependent methyltransferase